MGIINRYASGLLGLIDAQTQGIAPGTLSEVVAPVVDVRENFLLNLGYTWGHLTVTTGTPGIILTTAQVPAGRVHLLKHISLATYAADAVANSHDMEIAIFPPNGNTASLVTSSGLVATAAPGYGSSVARTYENPFALPAGYALQVVLNRIVGVPVLGWVFVLDWAYYDLVP